MLYKFNTFCFFLVFPPRFLPLYHPTIKLLGQLKSMEVVSSLQLEEIYELDPFKVGQCHTKGKDEESGNSKIVVWTPWFIPGCIIPLNDKS